MEKEDKKNILIVEDDPSTSDVYSIALIQQGFVVHTAFNGKEGLEKAQKEHPDLILLDILMPIMDGFTMLQELRKSGDYGKSVPVILLTNLSASNEDIIKKVAETEPVYYIVKISMGPEEIVEKIKERLSPKNEESKKK